MGFKVVRKVPSHYVSDDCLQQMLGYRDGVMIINSKGMIYEDTETDKYNSYLTDERRFDFPYHNIPTHIQRFGMRKYKFVNLILDYGKIYLHFTPQGMFTQQAFKNGEEGLVVYEREMSINEPEEKIVTREELDKYFEYDDNSFYICNGKPVRKIIIPTNEQILNFYKTELRIALTNNTTDRTISLEKIDEIIDGIINGITLNSIPGNFRFMPEETQIIIISDKDGKMELQIIEDIVFMSEDSFKMTIRNVPINSYTIDEIQDLKTYESTEPKISLWLNRNITRDDLKEAKRTLKK